jgi:hypothetical protein
MPFQIRRLKSVAPGAPAAGDPRALSPCRAPGMEQDHMPCPCSARRRPAIKPNPTATR